MEPSSRDPARLVCASAPLSPIQSSDFDSSGITSPASLLNRKKALLSNQCKEIEENRMGKTRDLLKKIRDTKGTFHAKMGSIKDRNGMD